MFLGEDELNAHITEVHVGHGKSVYECFWEGCDRHGNNAFPSKQKVMRHIQVFAEKLSLPSQTDFDV
jgi:hypothetical protein